MKQSHRRRSRMLSVMLGTALATGLASSCWGWVDMSRVSHVGDTWYVTPSSDEERDIDTVQYAIDSASPGETVVLARSKGVSRLFFTGGRREFGSLVVALHLLDCTFRQEQGLLRVSPVLFPDLSAVSSLNYCRHLLKSADNSLTRGSIIPIQSSGMRI